MANGIGITRGVNVWNFQNSYVEREMDNAAYTAAHPDDTLILAGPARKGTLGNNPASSGPASLLAIGMLQSIQFSSSKPTQPLMAIGSGRSFYVSGKAQTQWSIGRLFVNGRNLLRVLYHNAVASGLNVQNFDDPAAKNANSNFFVNLDSELFYIPFGMAAFFRNKAHDLVGSFYAELCMLNTWGIGMTAGAGMVLENVSGMADRLLPLELTSLATGKTATSIPRSTLDRILDFTASPHNSGPAGFEDTQLDENSYTESAGG